MCLCVGRLCTSACHRGNQIARSNCNNRSTDPSIQLNKKEVGEVEREQQIQVREEAAALMAKPVHVQSLVYDYLNQVTHIPYSCS